MAAGADDEETGDHPPVRNQGVVSEKIGVAIVGHVIVPQSVPVVLAPDPAHVGLQPFESGRKIRHRARTCHFERRPEVAATGQPPGGRERIGKHGAPDFRPEDTNDMRQFGMRRGAVLEKPHGLPAEVFEGMLRPARVFHAPGVPGGLCRANARAVPAAGGRRTHRFRDVRQSACNLSEPCTMKSMVSSIVEFTDMIFPQSACPGKNHG